MFMVINTAGKQACTPSVQLSVPMRSRLPGSCPASCPAPRKCFRRVHPRAGCNGQHDRGAHTTHSCDRISLIQTLRIRDKVWTCMDAVWKNTKNTLLHRN
eukprot:2538152-Pleurochrysis_carterae.AAC.8